MGKIVYSEYDPQGFENVPVIYKCGRAYTYERCGVWVGQKDDGFAWLFADLGYAMEWLAENARG